MAVADSQGRSSKFDKLSFVKYMKNIGRAYRKRAMELISICRTFVQVQEQTSLSDAELRRVLIFVDKTLRSATEAGKKTSPEADKQIEGAIQMLSEYQTKYHPTHPVSNVRKRMEEARQNDECSSTILNRLKESFRPIEPQPERTVEFFIHKSLPDRSPTSVKQVLSEKSHMGEILWNFSHVKDETKRLRLKQNPQFYASLPTSSKQYGDKFQEAPTENFQVKKIDVLTDNPGQTGRIYLQALKNRAFGNVWFPNRAIIFKDVCGKLEGESVVGEAIQDTPNLWCFEETPPQTSTSPRPRSQDRNSPLQTTTATPTRFTEGVSIQDWRKPIREMLVNLKNGRNIDINLRITAKPPRPSNFGRSYSAPSSPIPQPLLSSSDDNLLPIVHSQSLPKALRIQVPEPSAGPLTPSNYKTARNTPLLGRSPVEGLHPSIPEPKAPEPLSTLPLRLAHIVTTPSPAASSMALPRQQPATIALPLAGRVTPASLTARSASQISLERGSQRDTFPGAALSSSQARIEDVSPCGTITITPQKVIGTPRPHAEGNEGGCSGRFPSQPPKPYLEHVGSTSSAPAPDTGALPLKVQPPVVEQQPQTQKRNQNWFQKYLWDYKS